MFSTGLSTTLALFLASFAALCGALAIFLAHRARVLSRAAAEFARETASGRLDRAKIAEIDTVLTELSDAYDALLKSHKKLRSRLTMRQNRESQANGSDLSHENDKDKLRLQCRARGLLK